MPRSLISEPRRGPLRAFRCVLGGTGGADGKRYSRDEFRKAVVGKSKAQVTAMLGKPNKVDEKYKGEQEWCGI